MQPAIDLDAITLEEGSHDSREEGVCAMELVAWLAGEPHSDQPKCACPFIAEFVRETNDWLDDAERQGLKPYILRLVGTAGPRETLLRRAFALADLCVRTIIPRKLRALGDAASAAAIESLAPIADAASAEAASVAIIDIVAASGHAGIEVEVAQDIAELASQFRHDSDSAGRMLACQAAGTADHAGAWRECLEAMLAIS